MPIYEYKCLECSGSIEKLQKIGEEPLTVCGKCGGKLEKQVSLSGFQFKGAGWYVTDYAGKKADSKPVSTDKSSTDSKTEKIPAAESTAKPETASKPSQSSDSASKKD